MGAICRYWLCSQYNLEMSAVMHSHQIPFYEMKQISLSINISTRLVDIYSIVQVTNNNQLTSNYRSQPGWGDDMATFEMTIVANYLHGDYQLANGYGPVQAKSVLTVSFIVSELCHLLPSLQCRVSIPCVLACSANLLYYTIYRNTERALLL
jgi:hypothetical protein